MEATLEASKAQERKSSLNIEFLGGISRGHPGGYPGGCPGPKTFTPSFEAQESQVFCADVLDSKARTSMTRESLRKTLCRNLVTRIAATSKSQIASDCNRNSKKTLRLRRHPLKPTIWTRDPPVFRGFYSVSEAPPRSGNPPEIVATTIKGVIPNRSDFFGPMRFS